jgi:hypothetical protein
MSKSVLDQVLKLNAADVRQHAQQIGMMTAGEFRQRLGYDIHSFNQVIASGRAPASKFSLSNGEMIFDRADAEAFCKLLSR